MHDDLNLICLLYDMIIRDHVTFLADDHAGPQPGDITLEQSYVAKKIDSLTAGDPGGIHADYGGSDRRNQRRHFVVEPRQSRNLALTER